MRKLFSKTLWFHSHHDQLHRHLERIAVSNSTTVEWKRYVGGTIFTYKMDANMTPLATGSYDRRFVYTDHLGSIDVVTKSLGAISHTESFDAWGLRRSGENWTTMTDAQRTAALQLKISSSQIFTQPITTRGFTGHEMADDFGLINMNGRLYDPLIGRFLQADPLIQAPGNTQSYNRYSYTLNNPLNATDPSGFSWSLLGGFGPDLIKAASKIFGARTVNLIGSIVCSVSPWTEAAWAFMFSKAMGASNSAAFTSATVAFISANVFTSIGDKFAGPGFANTGNALGTSYSATVLAEKVFAHAMAGGIMSVFQGGKFGSGFVSAGVTQSFSGAIDAIGGSVGTTEWLAAGNRIIRVAAAAVVGGTASALSGGKFANGAVTGAFSRAFNDENVEHRSDLKIDSKKLTANFRGLVEAQIDKDGNAEVLLKADELKVTLTKEGWSAEVRGIKMVDQFGEGMSELGYSTLGTTVTLSNFSVNGFDARVTIPDKFFGIPSPFPKEIYSNHMDPITSLTNAITNNGMIGDSLNKLRDYNQKLQDI